MPTSAHLTKQLQPVFDGYLADPFVWQHEEFYYAIGTGAREANGHTVGKVFPILRSRDFHEWKLLDDAMVRPAPDLGDTFWAPAVAYDQGTFYLYYSVGHADSRHQLRVATSSRPEGPYLDRGHWLVDPGKTPFAIDPHPFWDTDGQWYLFYAADFLDCSQGGRAGTGLVMRRMSSMTQLEDTPQVVLRAHADWQRFRAGRTMYGAVWDWHTLEGPCVVKHDDGYYCFYSGGCWENESYGVDYAKAPTIRGPYSGVGTGGESGPRVLKSTPKLVGPGHNSWIVGPDGEEYLIFHAWDTSRIARRMFVTRLAWTEEGPRCEALT